MNAQKLIGLIIVLVIIVAGFVHGSTPMSEGARLLMHGWWIIWKTALILLAGCVFLVRRMRSALRPAESDAGVSGSRKDAQTTASGR
jgi:hypothetical protein